MDKIKISSRMLTTLCKELLPGCIDLSSWVFHAVLVKLTPGSRNSEGETPSKRSYFILIIKFKNNFVVFRNQKIQMGGGARGGC